MAKWFGLVFLCFTGHWILGMIVMTLIFFEGGV